MALFVEDRKVIEVSSRCIKLSAYLVVLHLLQLPLPAQSFGLRSSARENYDTQATGAEALALLAGQLQGTDGSASATVNPNSLLRPLSNEMQVAGLSGIASSPDLSRLGSGFVQEATSDNSVAARQARVEAFAQAEREVLGAQQKALEEFVQQQSALAARQHELQEKQRQIADEMKRADETFGFLEFLKLFAGDGKGRPPRPQDYILGISVYILFMLAMGFLYTKTLQDLPFSEMRRPPAQSQDGFAFNLFDGLCCDPDPRICICAICCAPVRWAATASHIKVGFQWFYPGIVVFALLATAGEFCSSLLKWAGVIPSVMLAMLVVWNRQTIRLAYGLPQSIWITIEDCLIWSCCGPCALMQEAMQVEFVDAANPAFQAPA